jgi:NADH-quinone oxidoreductase subunit N
MNPYLELLKLASPEAVMTITALVVLALQALRPKTPVAKHGAAAAGILLAGLAVVMLPEEGMVPNAGEPGAGMLVIDPLSSLIKLIVLGLALFTVLLARGATFTRYFGEYLALILLATIGLMVMVSSEQLLVIFVGLELTGLSLYILAGFDKTDIRSAEASLKYFLFGGVASAFTLFGLSLVYGMTGSTSLPGIAEALGGGPMEPLLAAGIVMTLIGFSFKVAAAPFHLWAPDAYQAAPVSSAAFIASASKVGSFFVLTKILLFGFDPATGSAGFQNFVAGWAPLLAVMAGLSIIVGNLVALAQKNLRRLLAYSAVAHAGYTLIGILGGGEGGHAAVIFYATAYAISILGAFGLVALVRRASGRADIADFACLRKSSPVLAACMGVFLLSLAGLPPLVGFFGKFYLFAAAYSADPGLLWLVLLALAGSLVSLYYYLSVLKVILVDECDADRVPDAIGGSRLSTILIVVLAALTLALGLFPNALLGAIMERM